MSRSSAVEDGKRWNPFAYGTPDQPDLPARAVLVFFGGFALLAVVAFGFFSVFDGGLPPALAVPFSVLVRALVRRSQNRNDAKQKAAAEKSEAR